MKLKSIPHNNVKTCENVQGVCLLTSSALKVIVGLRSNILFAPGSNRVYCKYGLKFKKCYQYHGVKYWLQFFSIIATFYNKCTKVSQ